MSIPNSHIRAALNSYLDRFPDEAHSVELLEQALEADHELSSRKEFRIGHATAGAVALTPEGRVLLIRHNALDAWLLPGGHLEPEDSDLWEASVRELEEETGISADLLESGREANAVPIDLDIHTIPANPAKGEPEHRHFDFRYLHRLQETPVRLQAEEVSDHAWRPHTDLSSPRLAGKIAELLTD